MRVSSQWAVALMLPLAACSAATAPEDNEAGVDARIISVEALSTLFDGNSGVTGLLTATATVSSRHADRLTISPCTAEIDIRLPSSRTWTTITPPRRLVCTAAVQELRPGESGVLAVNGDVSLFRGVAGKDARTVIVRIRYQATSSMQRYDLQSEELPVTRP